MLSSVGLLIILIMYFQKTLFYLILGISDKALMYLFWKGSLCKSYLLKQGLFKWVKTNHLGLISDIRHNAVQEEENKVEIGFHGNSEPWWRLCLSKCCLYSPAPGSKEQHDQLCLSQPILVILGMVPEGKRAMPLPLQMTGL